MIKKALTNKVVSFVLFLNPIYEIGDKKQYLD